MVEYGASHDTVINVVDGVPIPKGFIASPYEGENTKEKGLVIYELKEAEKEIPVTETKVESKKTRNQFVWVPVPDITKFAMLQDQSTNYRGVLYTDRTGNKFNPNIIAEETIYNANDGRREPAIVTINSDNTPNNMGTGEKLDGNNANIEKILVSIKYKTLLEQFQDEFNEMVKSVSIYGGFYVGRYETGGFNSDIVVSKLGENQESCTNKKWYTMYSMQKAIYSDNSTNKTGVISGMIYGCQWDAIMNWMSEVVNDKIEGAPKYIENSVNMGNYSADGPIDTGSHEDYSVKNIYDLAGNYSEWTQEAYGMYGNRVNRGGGYRRGLELGGTCSIRGNCNPEAYVIDLSSRLQLYIK